MIALIKKLLRVLENEPLEFSEIKIKGYQPTEDNPNNTTPPTGGSNVKGRKI